MAKIMGFSSFTSSKVILINKGKDHSGTTVECSLKSKSLKRKYRQYMCRRGGFNRILDPV